MEEKKSQKQIQKKIGYKIKLLLNCKYKCFTKKMKYLFLLGLTLYTEKLI